MMQENSVRASLRKTTSKNIVMRFRNILHRDSKCISSWLLCQALSYVGRHPVMNWEPCLRGMILNTFKSTLSVGICCTRFDILFRVLFWDALRSMHTTCFFERPLGQGNFSDCKSKISFPNIWISNSFWNKAMRFDLNIKKGGFVTFTFFAMLCSMSSSKICKVLQWFWCHFKAKT